MIKRREADGVKEHVVLYQVVRDGVQERHKFDRRREG